MSTTLIQLLWQLVGLYVGVLWTCEEGSSQIYSNSVQFLGCTLGWVALLLTRRGFGSIFVRLGARFLLWSLVPWGLSLLPVLRPGVPLAPSVAFLIGFRPL